MQRYVVRPEMVQDVLIRLQLQAPAIDAFGTATTTKCPVWWGPGAVAKTAWSQSWRYQDVGLLWCNPKFNVFDLMAIIRTIQQQKGRCILIAPDWPQEDFAEAMWPLAKRYYYYGPDSGLFEATKGQKAFNKQAWGGWALYLKGDQDEKDKQAVILAEVKVVRTTSSRRRYRRRHLRASQE